MYVCRYGGGVSAGMHGCMDAWICGEKFVFEKGVFINLIKKHTEGAHYPSSATSRCVHRYPTSCRTKRPRQIATQRVPGLHYLSCVVTLGCMVHGITEPVPDALALSPLIPPSGLRPHCICQSWWQSAVQASSWVKYTEPYCPYPGVGGSVTILLQ